jgi:DNA-binding HxlR family transcriptional regulator
MPSLRKPMRLEDCTVKATADVISGKWKTLILYQLKDGPVRFGELQRLIADASHKVLTEQLRELESDAIIARLEYPGKPLKVEYTLSAQGLTLKPILAMMAEWGAAFRARKNQALSVTQEHPENNTVHDGADITADAIEQ